jgi:F-type H+-transporting ATPase subunit gamma
MKVVASTKLSRAQRAMTESRAYGQTSGALFDKAQTKAVEREGRKKLVVVASSDKGLCGGIHSGLTKAVRRMMLEHPDADIVALGEKCKAQLGRSNARNMVLSFSNIGKNVPTFADAQAIADQVTRLPADYTSIFIVYNRFINATSFEPRTIEAYSQEAVTKSRTLAQTHPAPF